MSIDRLQKAASAAGFAMATPDDEPEAEAQPEISVARAVVVVTPVDQRTPSQDTVRGITTWLKSFLPGTGWRQPA